MATLQDKTCVTCGGNLRFNRSNGFFECEFCGKIHTTDKKEAPLSLAVADEYMHAHQYVKAKAILAKLRELEPDNALFLLRVILCRFRMTETAMLLNSSRNNPVQLRAIKEVPEWEELRKILPSDKKDFVDRVFEYCDISLKINDLKRGIKKKKSFLAQPMTRPYRMSITDPEDAYEPGLISEKEAEKTKNNLVSRIKSKVTRSDVSALKANREATESALADEISLQNELLKKQKDLFVSVKELELSF